MTKFRMTDAELRYFF